MVRDSSSYPRVIHVAIFPLERCMPRFLHLADIHLDSPLRGLSKYDGVTGETLRSASRRAFSQAIQFALCERVDFVVIAGDLYDGTWQDFSTGLFFVREISRLAEAGIHVYLISGNHDAASIITTLLSFPDRVVLFPHHRPHTIVDEGLGLAVHGQSFAGREVQENLASAYPTRISGLFNLGILHTSLSGRPGHASYAPCTDTDLAAKEYSYWALGHVHQFEIVSRDPWIVFSGCIQGRHCKETGPKGGVLVTYEGTEVTDVTFHEFDVIRWEALPVELPGSCTSHEVASLVAAAISQAFKRSTDRPLVVRLQLRGRTSAHGWCSENAARLRAECRAAAYRISETIWIEKVLVETTSETELLVSEHASDTDDSGPIPLLFRTIEALLEESALEIPAFHRDLHDLRNAVPAALLERRPELFAAQGVVPTELLMKAKDLLRALLVKGE